MAHPDHVTVRGARVHNLRNVDVDVPLGELVGIAGVSGSGKSSLALGVLYAEGSKRYLEALSAYTRRRISQHTEAKVDLIDNVPAAIALHQRPSVPSVRSTFGTMTEVSNVLRLMTSRLGSYLCPNGHRVPPSTGVASDAGILCPVCGVRFNGLSAESFSFNSDGACPSCSGTGVRREVDESKLVPDESLTVRDGAVVAWNMFGIQWMHHVAAELGVRTEVPFSELTPEEREIIYHGPEVQRIVNIPSKNGKLFELNCTYRNAVKAVEEAMNGAVTDKGMERIERFLRTCPCPECGGTRLNAPARSVTLGGRTLPEVEAMTLSELSAWLPSVVSEMPPEVRDMADNLLKEFTRYAARLLDLGLGYLSPDRPGGTLSTGERQRVHLARSVRSNTTGVMYVLDEPSIGLHPANVDGLYAVVRDLIDKGNSVVLVDHDVRIIGRSDYLIEMGPGAGSEGGNVIARGTPEEVVATPGTRIGPYLEDTRPRALRNLARSSDMFSEGAVELEISGLHTVKPLTVRFPKGRMTAVTGVSGSGKTTLVLESLIPAIDAYVDGSDLPDHVVRVDPCGVGHAVLIDSTPIGANVRSTVSTYSGVLDDLRKLFAKTDSARRAGVGAKDLSYNTGSLRCPSCDGTGQVSLDLQFLPDVDMVCPDCGGLRYGPKAAEIKLESVNGRDLTLPYLMGETISQALRDLSGLRGAREKLAVLEGLGLGYLTLGEATPSLSGGEAQRLKLASEMGRPQSGTLFVFDEPTIGLHPLDVQALVKILDDLVKLGATVIVIEHDLDLIASCDYIVDMGPGGGEEGGRVVSNGTPDEIRDDPNSVIGRYL